MEPEIISALRAIPLAVLSSLADPLAVERGRHIDARDITVLQVTDRSLLAQVIGTEPYTVALRSTGDLTPSAVCTCPVAEPWCKHAVAVALKAPERLAERDELVDEALAIRSPAQLLGIIDTLREEVPAVEPVLTRLTLRHPVERCDLDLEAVTDALIRARRTRSPEDWEFAFNTIASRGTLASLEQLIAGIAEQLEGTLLIDDSLNAVVTNALRLHPELVKREDADPDDVAVFLASLYFSPACPDPDLSAYASVLDDLACETMMDEAHFHNATGRFPQAVDEMRLDLALFDGDLDTAWAVSSRLPYKDKLLRYYAEKGMDAEAKFLVAQAASGETGNDITVPLLEHYARRYFGNAGVIAVRKREFERCPNVWTYAAYLECPGLSPEEAIDTANHPDAYTPDLAMMAATTFRDVEYGQYLLDHHPVRTEIAAAWALDVGIFSDADAAMELAFRYVALVLAGTATGPAPGPTSRTTPGSDVAATTCPGPTAWKCAQLATQSILYVEQVAKTADRHAPDTGAQLAFQTHLAIFKTTHEGWPYLAEALAQTPL